MQYRLNKIRGKVIIYKATNKVNGKVYIGQTINSLEERKRKHKSDSKRIDIVFCRAIRKYGFDNFEWEILCRTNNRNKLNALEKFYIMCYRKIGSVYNMTDGGDGTTGYKLTEWHKDRIRQSKIGKNNPQFGKSPSIETRKKLSEARKGKKLSEESKAKLSETRKKLYKNLKIF